MTPCSASPVRLPIIASVTRSGSENARAFRSSTRIAPMHSLSSRTGAIIEQKFIDKDRFPRVRIDRVPMQYLYSDNDRHFFMDLQSYDQVPLNDEQLGDGLRFLKENTPIAILMYEGRPLGVELPTTVELKVTETPPGFRGDTATGGGKPATLETGVTLTVPFFINQGDIIRVDTRTGEYVERVS